MKGGVGVCCVTLDVVLLFMYGVSLVAARATDEGKRLLDRDGLLRWWALLIG